ncbi:MAG: oligoendopeptidase F [Firmicutes bacterium]|nr:oligoendopeptidase F [Bacillota bacterium]
MGAGARGGARPAPPAGRRAAAASPATSRPAEVKRVEESVTPAGAAGAEVPEREQLEPRWRWRLEDLFPDAEAWEEVFRQAEGRLPELAAQRGRLGRSPADLLAVLRLADELSLQLERLVVYASLRLDEDQRVARNRERLDRALALAHRAAEAGAFLEPEILALEPGRLERWQREEPGLGPYRPRLERLARLRPHVRSEETEALLAAAGELAQAPERIFQAVQHADLRFPRILDEQGREVEMSHGRYVHFLESRDREVRRRAFAAMGETLAHHRHTLAASLHAEVRKNVFFARARRYASAREAALTPHQIPVEVYDNLVATVRRHLDLLHRWVTLRRRALGLESIHLYDVYVPVAAEPAPPVPYEEAVRLVEEGLRPLGERYAADLDEALRGGWVDVYENRGKVSGAYTTSVYGTHPYVLLNYQGDLDGVFTLAHEMGHAMHSFYSNAAQPYPTARYALFVAEVASTLNESLLIQELLERSRDPQEERRLLDRYLQTLRTTLFRQTLFAEFEQRIHELVEAGGALHADNLSELYHRLNVDYYGPEMTVDPEIDLEWARIPHFYMNFYVYQYATAVSAATALAERIRRGEDDARERYLRFLASGSARDPLDLLAEAGVDLRSPEPIEQTLAFFAQLLDRFEATGL